MFIVLHVPTVHFSIVYWFVRAEALICGKSKNKRYAHVFRHVKTKFRELKMGDEINDLIMKDIQMLQFSRTLEEFKNGNNDDTCD